MLDLVDDETACIEGFAAVLGTYTHPHRHIAQPERAHPMNAQCPRHRESPQRFIDDAIAFLDREFFKRLVFQARDLLTLVMIPDPPLETDVAARAQVLQLLSRSVGVDRGVGEAKAHQPPATGGMKTTASPGLSFRDQSLNSLLTATFNCSRMRVNPYRPANSPYRAAGVPAEVSRVSSERPACS